LNIALSLSLSLSLSTHPLHQQPQEPILTLFYAHLSLSSTPLSLSLSDPAQPQPPRQRTPPLLFLSVFISLHFYVGLAIRGGDLHVVGEVVRFGLETTSASRCGEKSISEGGSNVD
ncbi:unnamed protein product, partial [Prunus brigantina]